MLFEYLSAYGIHIALCTILSAVTAYRREISCNHGYHDDVEGEGTQHSCDKRASNTTGNRTTPPVDESVPIRDCINLIKNNKTEICNEDDELMTEKLLEGAGLYCSGKPVISFASLLWLGLEFFDRIEEDNNGESDENTSSSSSSSTSNSNNDTRDTDNDEGSHQTLMPLTPEDLLDRVGNYASPSELISGAISLFTFWKKRASTKDDDDDLYSLSTSSLSSSSRFSSSRFCNCKNVDCDPFMRGIPSDAHVHIASYLHPRDVVTLSCVSKAYYTITDEPRNATSVAIWKTLWHRDYAWIVYRWAIGKQALMRSNCTQRSYNKDFYFLFGQSYLNYVLAGQNTYSNCLVGIHSNIYDITSFLFSHPGSPDTLMVHSGRDATDFFDDIGHSTAARRLAMSMCVVIDRSAQNNNNYCGLFPTTHTTIATADDKTNNVNDHPLPARLSDHENKLLLARRRRILLKNENSASIFNYGNTNNTVTNGPTSRRGTLHRVRARFLIEERQVRRHVTRKYSNDSTVLGQEVNPYFDPFTRKWCIWYTDTDLQTIYLSAE